MIFTKQFQFSKNVAGNKQIENYLRMILRISKCCKLLPPTNIMIQDSVLGTVITV